MNGKLAKQIRKMAANPNLPYVGYEMRYHQKQLQLKELNVNGTPRVILFNVPQVFLTACQKKLARLWKETYKENKSGCGQHTGLKLITFLTGESNG